MKTFFLVFGLMLLATCASAQTPIQQQRCYAQACMLNPWRTIAPGETLVVIVRPVAAQEPACYAVANCGNTVWMVTDNYGDVFQPAYHASSVSQAYVAFNVKGRPAGCCYSSAPPLLVGIVASTGYGGYGNLSTGGFYNFDVMILEYPPALGFDGNAVSSSYLNGGGNNTPRVYPGVTTASSKTLLVAWAILKPWDSPLHVTYVEAPWKLLTDDGFVSVSSQEVTAPGVYGFEGLYDGYGFWDAGIVALAME